MRTRLLFHALARSFLADEQTVAAIVGRSAKTLGREWPWLRPLARRYLTSSAGRTRPRHRDVIQFLKKDRGFKLARLRYSSELWVEDWLAEPQRMHPVPAASGWDLPRIESIGALCDWLWLDATQLDWFSDLKGLNLKSPEQRLNHYDYRVLRKTDGGIRLIEAPKSRLKNLQRQILTEILDRIPPHPAVHGFVRGRSIKTFAAPHAGQRVVLRMDLRDFFPTFRAARIQTFFRTIGYPEPVADLLGGLCTNSAPRSLWTRDIDSALVQPARMQEARLLYSRPHLPQGAPASPSLANMCSYRLDCRLAGLAESAGANYSRYADDLAFSGDEDFARPVDRFATHVAAIVREEGFGVNHRKTRVMRRGVRQHLAGLVVNEHLNVNRHDFDVLKAILTNCIRLGPDTQNRDRHVDFRAHLEGRVAFVESVHAVRGAHLRELLAKIRW
jgi:hypothetical protein